MQKLTEIQMQELLRGLQEPPDPEVLKFIEQVLNVMNKRKSTTIVNELRQFKDCIFLEVRAGSRYYDVVEEAKEMSKENDKPVFFFFNDYPTFVTSGKVLGGLP